MVPCNKYNCIAFLIFVLNCPLNICRETDNKKIYVKQLVEQKPRNTPNIFDVFKEIINNKVENPLTNPKYKEILDRADGINNLKPQIILKPRPLVSLPAISSTSAESVENSEEMSKEIKKLINFALMNTNLLSAYEDGKGIIKNTKSLAPKINLNESTLQDVMLRMGTSCNKGASKACVTACKSVLKGVCHEYKCSNGLKSRFKSECSRNCRTRFGVN